MASLHVDAALIGSLIIVLMFAAREDLLEHRIPNVLVAVGLGVGILIHTSVRGWDGTIFSLLGALVGLGALLPFYLLRGMGAGDVKLMAAVGSFLGPVGAFFAAAVTLVLGALLATGIVVVRRLNRLRSAGSRADTSDFKERFPYAIAIAGGALILMWHQGHLARLIAIVTA